MSAHEYNENSMYTIKKIQSDYTHWKYWLGFYRDEMSFFRKEIDNKSEMNTKSLSRMEVIDEYKDRLDGKSEKLNNLYDRINNQEKAIEEEQSKKTRSLVHLKINNDIQNFYVDYGIMKNGFRIFAAQND